MTVQKRQECNTSHAVCHRFGSSSFIKMTNDKLSDCKTVWPGLFAVKKYLVMQSV